MNIQVERLSAVIDAVATACFHPSLLLATPLRRSAWVLIICCECP
ncbi:hypothetical protein ACUTQ5_10965 [Serratia sp. NA_112.1]